MKGAAGTIPQPTMSAPAPASKKLSLKRIVSILLAVLIGAGLGAAGRWLFFDQPLPPLAERPNTVVGGPFSLTDQFGIRVQDADFRGKLMLVYFGYTYCPDVCPTELQTITAALETLGTAAGEIVPIFITVDPARDTVTLMKDYAANFHPALRALSGSPEDVATAARSYRIYYAKVQGEGDDDYRMDHTSIVYLMDRKGQYLAHFPAATAPERMAKRLRQAL
jgi:protein SCO1/2|tara:strand:- start:214 stop:879 length:666 start_codon:yes stop_codon:yes gene_type:complete